MPPNCELKCPGCPLIENTQARVAARDILREQQMNAINQSMAGNEANLADTAGATASQQTGAHAEVNSFTQLTILTSEETLKSLDKQDSRELRQARTALRLCLLGPIERRRSWVVGHKAVRCSSLRVYGLPYALTSREIDQETE